MISDDLHGIDTTVRDTVAIGGGCACFVPGRIWYHIVPRCVVPMTIGSDQIRDVRLVTLSSRPWARAGAVGAAGACEGMRV